MTAVSHVPASQTGAPHGRTGPAIVRRRWVPYALLLPGVAWLVLFFAIPMAQLLAASLYDPSGSLESGYQLTWHWQNFPDAWSEYSAQFIRSFGYAGIATLATLVLSYPLAYVIAFKAGRWRGLLLVLVIAPFFTSFLVRTLAWTSILADNGFVADTLRALGLLAPDGRLLATSFAVVTGLIYNFLPFMTLPLFASLDRLDPRVIEAAHDLYASSWTTFRKVTFPLSLPGVVAGTLLTFIPAVGDFINAEILGTPRQFMIGNVIDSSFLVRLDYPTAAALSITLMVSIAVLVWLYIRRTGTEELV